MQLIPRIIHRVWFGGAMPEEYVAYGEGWARNHPGWEMRLWHEDNLPPLRNRAEFDAAPTLAQKADIARYEILHRFGGVYVDCDFESLRSIEPLLSGVEAFAASEDGTYISIGIMGCVPQHDCVDAVILAVPPSLAGRPHDPPNQTTGPHLVTRVALERAERGLSSLVVFGPSLFYPYRYDEPHRKDETFPDAYAVHHWAGSWLPRNASSPVSTASVEKGTGPTRVSMLLPRQRDAWSMACLGAALAAIPEDSGVELALALEGADEVDPVSAEELSTRCLDVAGSRNIPDVVLYGAAALMALPSVATLTEASPSDVGALVALGRALEEPAPPAPPAPAPIPVASTPVAVYVGNDRLLVRTSWGSKLYADSRDLSITPELALTGEFDQGLCRWLMANVAPGAVCVDVGANIGVLTVLMARLVGPSGRVIAYEANPHVFSLLRDNVSVNYLNGWVDCRKVAAWSSSGTATFHISERFRGNSSVLKHDSWYHDYFGVDEFDEVEVETEPLDPVLARLARVDLVKVDVEGGELEVLLGMREALETGKVRRLVVEVVRVRMGESWAPFCDLLRVLAAAGFGFSHIGDDGAAHVLDVEQVIAVGYFSAVLISR